ncbi:carbamoyl phosphate synthase small subunit [Pectinatus cerevisiiphilus]|uniref:Carbamoyl phosphate synthase small chain n=1 Tax=Pectinatus cerevisiiphilus TaxID=86956 RepID=A0A4R3KEX0_9FIRM|nr:carbamoyl phosphate synthase small subunit [Pectinatus cerevisiiphilus]TCS81894.1 carbamoyl-phosphate synthase small subunit [Pectinatus cerevisiiphilus]
MKGKLVLEDGSTFTGDLLGDKPASGEVVFNTGMTGYQEILTDPSYCSQIITLTYPLIGNYGTAEKFNQSRKCFANGFVIGELCEVGSNWQKENELSEFLQANGIPCLYNVDTRALTRRLRSAGTMKGIIITTDTPKNECDELMAIPLEHRTVDKVTTPEKYVLENDGLHIVAMDFGVKKHMLESMHERGCKITVVPAHTTAQEILALQPDGIFLSNGPGDPKDVLDIVETIKQLIGKKPIFGICLGHQLIALACGADTYKLKFGHRGSNQPVKDLRTGRVYISAQNHGYAVDEKSLAKLPFDITHISMNDGTVEGMHHQKLPLFSVQYHPEASPGPDDNTYLFDEFCAMMKKGAN